LNKEKTTYKIPKSESETNAFLNYGCPSPVFENFQHGFRVTVFSRQNNNKKTDLKNIGGNVIVLKKIIELMRANPSISIPDISAICNKGVTIVKEYINKLKSKNIIRRIGPDKGGHWEVIK
jgi:ATP-dependent DNA helicase RecG